MSRMHAARIEESERLQKAMQLVIRPSCIKRRGVCHGRN